MSNQQSKNLEAPTPEETLIFLTHVIKAFEDEFGEPLSVNNTLMSDNILDDAGKSRNLVLEYDTELDRVIVRTSEV